MLKLSVIVPVYNLERYVKDCLLGLLQQKTNFEYEVIVADDHSTDRSATIIREIQKEFPTKLKTILKNKNAGLAENMRSLLTAVSGEFIAYIDGDDLALANKLQYQVDYLDANPKCNMVYHESDMFDSDSDQSIKKYSQGYYNWAHIEQKSTVEHLIKYGTFLQAGSVMFRNHPRLLESVPDHNKIILDYPFYIANAAMLGGSIDYIDQVLGRYRIHNESFGQLTQHSVERRLQALADMSLACKQAKKYGISEAVIKQGIYHHYYSTALYFLKKNNFEQFLALLEKSTDGQWFFDPRHQFAYQNRASASLIRKKLGI